MRKILAAVFILGASALNVYAQVPDNPTPWEPNEMEVQKIPPNPEVADLGKFGDLPVNAYNGTANVGVPIHSVPLDEISIPLSLSYNTGGIRVEQEASWVGLGWSLDPGITITRDINGFDDLENDNVVGWVYSHIIDLYDNSGHPFYQFELNLDTLQALENAFSANLPIDTEPDIYTVSLPTGSFKFYLEKLESGTTLDTYIFDEKGYKVSYDISTENFTVIDQMGYTYDFSVKEKSTGLRSQGEPTTSKTTALQAVQDPVDQENQIITSWKVASITSPFDKSLTFTYTDGFYFSYPNFSESYSFAAHNNQNNNYSPEVISFAVPSSPNISVSMTAFYVKQLSKIEGDFGSVNFNLSDRKDQFSKLEMRRISGNSAWNYVNETFVSKKLSSIDIKNSESITVKTVDFTYDYFNGHKENATDAVDYIRLKLDEVSVNDQVYSFSYIDEDLLPKKDSRSQDFWGYGNGKANNHLIPAGSRFYLVYGSANINNDFFERLQKWSGADRSVDFSKSKRGILEKITYPTGGYSKFTYESNTVTIQRKSFVPDMLTTGQVIEYNIGNSDDLNYNYQMLKRASDVNYDLLNNASRSKITQTSTASSFTVTYAFKDQEPNVKIKTDVQCTTGNCNEITGFPDLDAVWITDQSGTKTVIREHGVNNEGIEEYELRLAPGTYTIHTQAYSEYLTPQNEPLILAASHVNTVLQTVQDNNVQESYDEFNVGGARIAKLTNYDSDNSVISARAYNYDHENPDATTSSSGVLMDQLVFHSSVGGTLDYSTEKVGDPSLSSSNQLRTNPSASGSIVGYSRVTEKSVDLSGADNGEIVRNYHNLPNEYYKRDLSNAVLITGVAQNMPQARDRYKLSNWQYTTIPYGEVYALTISPKNFSYINGQVIDETILDDAGDTVQYTTYSYDEIDQPLTQTFSPSTDSYGNYGSYDFHFPKIFTVNQKAFLIVQPFYKMRLDDYGVHTIQRPISSTTKQYFDNGNIETTTVNDYTADHYFPYSTKTEKSDGSLVTSYTYYATNSNASFADDLVDENRLKTVIETKRYEGTSSTPNQKLLSTSTTTYSNSLNTANHWLPSHRENRIGNSTATSGEVDFELYDEKGNLLQYRSRDDNTVISLVWSYDGTYPVAKIVNATYAQVASAAGKTQAQLKVLDASELSVLNTARNNLSSALVTTYEYIPGIGMTKQTDANGVSTTYTYDTSGRLKLIKDQDGKTIKQFNYNYIND